MPTSVNVTNLKINELKEAQYDTAVQQGVIGENELSILTDAENKAVQVDTMPTASVTELGNIYQFVGTTDSTYTNGYFYKCVSDGQTPATYSWTRVDVQPQGDSLPSQTGNAGKFLTTDGTNASWGNALENKTRATNALGIISTGWASNTIVIGYSANVNYSENTCSVLIGNQSSLDYLGYHAVCIGYASSIGERSIGCTAIGRGARCVEKFSISIGCGARTTASHAIQIGTSSNSVMDTTTNSNANTLKVANANGNFEIMSADGTIPTDRFTTTPSADGTYVPTLTISSGTATRSWAAPAGGATSATATLAVADWSNNSQTVNVTGVTASNNVIVAAAPASQSDYTTAGILCTAQGAGTLTFTCTTTPSSAITVNVLII